MKKPISITVLTGYLGSGKTTLVNRILADPQGQKIAVIVNDLGEVNIDADLIAKNGQANLTSDSLVALSNGCICCDLQTDLMTQIVRLAKMDEFDYILIEASGICEPMPVAQSIAMMDGSMNDRGIPAICKLDAVVAVIDAYRMQTEFSGGKDLIKDSEDDGEPDLGRLFVEQIEFCNLVLLNKTDLLSEDEVNKVEEIVRALQPSAQIIRTSFSEIPTTQVLNTNLFRFDKTFMSAGWAKSISDDNNADDSQGIACSTNVGASSEHDDNHEDAHAHHHDDHDHHHDHHHHHGEGHSHYDEYGVSTFMYYRRQPFDDSKLEKLVYNFPKNVIRCKGLVWIDDGDDTSFLLEQAGQSVSVMPLSPWIASMPKEEQERILSQSTENTKNWDPEVGDRMTKLVFIGSDMDQEAIIKAFDDCLA